MDEEENLDKNKRKTGSVKVQAVKYDVPVDRGWAWMVLLGGFGVCTLAIGGLKSFGVLFVELSRTYSVSYRALASIQSLTGFFFLGTGPFSNALSLKYSHRKVVFIGGVITSTGLILSSFAKSVEVLYITYGVITGLGLGLCFTPSLVIVAHYFEKRRSFANGFSMSGSGIGSTSLPYMMRYFMDIYSIQGCFMIIAGIMSHLCLFGLMYRPLDQYPVKSDDQDFEIQDTCATNTEEQVNLMTNLNDSGINGSLKNKNIDDSNSLQKSPANPYLRHPDNMLVSDFSSQPNISSKGITGKKFSPLEKFRSQELLPLGSSKENLRPGKISLYASLGVLSSLSFQNIPSSIEVTVKTTEDLNCQDTVSNASDRKKNKVQRCCESVQIDWSLFKNPVFVMFMLSIFCLNCGYHSVFNLLPPYVEELHMSDKNGALLVAIFGIMDFCGRLFAGVIMDFCSSRKKQIYFICTFVCAVGVLLTPQFTTITNLCLFCGFYGFFGGGYNGTLVSVLVESLGLERLSSAWGFMCFAGSISMLLHPVLAGLIKDTTGTWKNSFRVLGAIAIIGSLILLIEPVFLKSKKKKEKTIYMDQLK